MSLKSDPTRWKDRRHRRGFEGELVAIGFLRGAGWELLAHRYRIGRWEVDLVARKGTLVAFVEVKCRWSVRFGLPEEAVTWAKRREIQRVAQGWIDRRGQTGDAYRFDVIGILFRHGIPVEIRHVEDAFRVGWR